MRVNHILLGIAIAAIWGCNFISVEWALQDLPPYLLCALRFLLTAVPAVLFLPKPKIAFKQLLIYGLFTFALQFACLFAGLNAGLPPGLASLVFQTQVFWSLLLAALFLDEIPRPIQILGAMISFSGLILIALHHNEGSSWLGFVLVLIAAASMGVGNLLSRQLCHVQPLALVAWGNLLSFPILGLCSLVFEGPELISQSLSHIGLKTIGSLVFTAYASTWFAYGLWNHLLRVYSISTVIPFTLLVPFFGMLSVHYVLDEPMQPWKIQATWIILGGLFINILGSRWVKNRQQLNQSKDKLHALDSEPQT